MEHTPNNNERPNGPETLEAARRREIDAKLTGIGGWLITYSIYQALNAFSYFFGLTGEKPLLDEFTRLDTMVAADLERVISLTSILGGLSVVGIIICFFLMSARKKNFPKACLLLIGLQTVITILGASMLQEPMQTYLAPIEYRAFLVGLLLQLVINFLWMLYFVRSRRVRLTFTQ